MCLRNKICQSRNFETGMPCITGGHHGSQGPDPVSTGQVMRDLSTRRNVRCDKWRAPSQSLDLWKLMRNRSKTLRPEKLHQLKIMTRSDSRPLHVPKSCQLEKMSRNRLRAPHKLVFIFLCMRSIPVCVFIVRWLGGRYNCWRRLRIIVELFDESRISKVLGVHIRVIHLQTLDFFMTFV